ncbi:hypothetical protein RF11_15474 [Thelohanellus kitauei]|uniref:Uncharacterized protein n=1 Tax=Thelohanellus kitauei TaxID=669202 RepID=A0A0C2J1Q5_THEKT|nr:hypothetical protein RF11_15474 [Thelohanellus kitauei]
MHKGKQNIFTRKILCAEISPNPLDYRNQNCDDPNSGFRRTSGKRKLTESYLIKLQDEGENIITLPTLRCRSCNTYLSPRTKGFLSYFDTKMRANCKLSTSKNHCRIVCQNANIAHFSSRKLGGGRGERVDESLLRAIRQANRRRILAENEDISIEDRMDLNRNNGMRIEGPLVFGMIECTLQNDGSYKSG